MSDQELRVWACETLVLAGFYFVDVGELTRAAEFLEAFIQGEIEE